MNIQTVLRAQDVTRWNIVHTVRKQSLAEHLFNTAMIARRICEIMNVPVLTFDRVMNYALKHDLDEIITGDIPSPTKKRAMEAGVDLNSLLQIDELTAPAEVMRIVKAADLLENLWYIEQYGHGRHAKEVMARLHAELFKGWASEGTEFTAARQVYHDLTHGEITI